MGDNQGDLEVLGLIINFHNGPMPHPATCTTKSGFASPTCNSIFAVPPMAHARNADTQHRPQFKLLKPLVLKLVYPVAATNLVPHGLSMGAMQ